MELVYLYLHDYRSIHMQEFNFCEEYEFRYKEGKLTYSEGATRIPNFFSKNIINATAIAGKNGSGKTTLTSAIYMFVGNNVEIEAIYVLRDLDSKSGLKIYAHESFSLESAIGINGLSDIPTHQYSRKKHLEQPQPDPIRIFYSTSVDNDIQWSNKYDISTTRYLKSQNEIKSQNISSYKLFKRGELRRQIGFVEQIKNKNLRIELPTIDFYNYIGIYFNNPNYYYLGAKERLFPAGSRFGSSLLERVSKKASNDGRRVNHINDKSLIAEIFAYLALQNLYFESTKDESAQEKNKKRILILQKMFEQESFSKLLLHLRTLPLENDISFKNARDFILTCWNCRAHMHTCTVGQYRYGIDDCLTFFQLILNIDVVSKIYDSYLKTIIGLDYLDFHWHISSGENAYLSLLSRLFSIRQDIEETEKSETIWLIIDEGEVHLHPEWQKMYFKDLINDLPEIFPRKRIQMIITTHSPFLLSDFPATNVIFMGSNERHSTKTVFTANEIEIKTFGENINVLFTDSFFVKGAFIGDFAKQKIKSVMKFLNHQNTEDKSISRKTVKTIIDWIGEPMIRNKLIEMYNDYLIKPKK